MHSRERNTLGGMQVSGGLVSPQAFRIPGV